MGNQWTEEQKQVISLRDCNMLVAAAAGAGKTAVLVERIISRILDEKKPVDIDRLLVVTFTNAAAAEMRERVEAALEDKLEEFPDNVHLQRQLTLVHHAQITTIHSFCLELIRSHFHLVHLDPGFRIGDEGELKLLRQDIMDQLLEQAYEEADPDFMEFAEAFAPGRTDSGLEEIIQRFYDFSMGYPWPEKWRQQCAQVYAVSGKEQFYQAPWMKSLLQRLECMTEDMRQQIRMALEIAGEPDGPWMYEEALRQDLQRLDNLRDCPDYGAYAARIASAGAWTVLSRKRDPSVSEEKKNQVKELRDQVKKDWSRMEEEYFFVSPEQMAEDMYASRSRMEMLIRLTDRFQEAYEAGKAEKNLVDFNDLEHFALQILVKEEEGEIIPTETALEYAKHYQEVMIDEYQDSNLVQEILLASVSRTGADGNDRFMVGDVKQSIYRFRLARPELFMEKYRTYTSEEGVNRRIDLHKNFRSRRQVLESVNLIFRQIMGRALGDVEYDEAAALSPGASFPEGASEEFLEPELLLVTPDDREAAGEEEEVLSDLRRLEAEAAAERILEIVGRELIWDKEEKQYRKARYSDVVVLLRTVSGWAEDFSRIFSDLGIPCYTGTDTGYFSALEVRTVLSFLQVLDNPRQDIPLAAVLASPIGGMTEEELARLRIASPDTDFYTCCVTYLQRKEARKQAEGQSTQQPEAALSQKLRTFWELMEELRAITPYTPMHLLLWKILERTGYGDYVTAMPGGAARKANLDMLVEKAVAYEATSYRGLFHFIRYIENLQKYQVDYGEASALGEAEDAVRIMSIHKSKGLEFPVVLVCGLGKSFNQQDARGSLLLHPSLGMGCDFVDLKQRIRIPLLIKKVIAGKLKEETLGEELRVLYVAMTRARDKLILTGAVKDLEKAGKKWSRELRRQEEKLSWSCLVSASSYLDWILPALLRHVSAAEFLEILGLSANANTHLWNAPGGFRIRIRNSSGHRQKQLLRQTRVLETKEALLGLLEGKQSTELLPGDDRIREHFAHMQGKTYPWAEQLSIPGKLSVSELKRAAAWEMPEEASMLYQEPQVVPLLPRFVKQEEPGGAARGTAYHHFLENLDFTESFHGKFVDSQLETMIKCGKILEDEASWISREKIRDFLASPLAGRMQAAARRGELYRERPFVLGEAANKIREDWDGNEQVLIQGIIDAYFYEGEEIVLMDYKTDYVPEGEEEKLAAKYGEQLEYYQRALERLTGKKVKEKWIYSFCLGKAVAGKDKGQ